MIRYIQKAALALGIELGCTFIGYAVPMLFDRDVGGALASTIGAAIGAIIGVYLGI